MISKIVGIANQSFPTESSHENEWLLLNLYLSVTVVNTLLQKTKTFPLFVTIFIDSYDSYNSECMISEIMKMEKLESTRSKSLDGMNETTS